MVIKSWKEMLAVVGTLDEKELLETINFEAVTYKRKNILERLHQRYTKLRSQRERATLMEGGMIL